MTRSAMSRKSRSVLPGYRTRAAARHDGWLNVIRLLVAALVVCCGPMVCEAQETSLIQPVSLAGSEPEAADPGGVESASGLSTSDPLEPEAPESTPDALFLTPAASQAPAQPEHTGFQALVRATGSDFKALLGRPSTFVILGLGGTTAALALPVDDEVTPSLHGSSARMAFRPGRLIGYAWVQAGAAIGTYVIGRYVIKPTTGRTNKISHVGFDLLRAQIVTGALTYALKVGVNRDRPTGECCSFPSGHASVTFASAAVLERHFGYRAAWPTLAVGGYVAASRLFENRHFLSDVLFGSALGLAAGWTVVGRHGRDHFALLPTPVPGGAAVMVTWRPGE